MFVLIECKCGDCCSIFVEVVMVVSLFVVCKWFSVV